MDFFLTKVATRATTTRPTNRPGLFPSFFRPSGPIAQLAELRTFNP